MTKVLGIIPARGGSKSIPHKNLRELAGRPLLAYAADGARQSGVIDRLVVSTDSEKIAELGRALDIEVPLLRPAELSGDETPMLPVLQHVVAELETEGWKPEIIVLLQPTSPLRRPEHIRQAVEKLQSEECDSVVSVLEIPHIYAPQKALRLEADALKFWHSDGPGITRRQQLETAYAREGTVYAFWRETLMEQGSIYGTRCLPLILEPQEALTLDTEDDWQRAEHYLRVAQKELL
ncbi:MAG: acylneuraminate cytidylyltransferase family protein [Chloroflexi bacterium]|nr:acylneuraminate cytidylyltransferase family protein [Chloroflexota bacterium]